MRGLLSDPPCRQAMHINPASKYRVPLLVDQSYFAFV